jgi:hypothetical protein
MKRILKSIFLSIATLFVIILISFFVFVVWPVKAPPKPNHTLIPVAISNVSVINPIDGSITSGQTVVIEKGRIVDCSSTVLCSIPQNARQIEGTGKFLIPGLWDMHIHVWFNISPQLTMPLFIAGGVTNIREMGGGASLVQKNNWRQQILSGNLLGPRLIGQASLTVSSLNSEDEAREILKSLDYSETDFIKVFNAVLPDPLFSLLENKKGIPVLGHKPRAVRAIDAANAGFKSFEHARLFLFECYPGAQKLRERYLARYTSEDTSHGRIETTEMRREMIDTHDSELFNELVEAMVKNNTWFCPTHITRKMDAFADDKEYREDERLKYINFAQRLDMKRDADGMIDRAPSPEGRKSFMDFYLKGLELTGKAHRAGVKILAGTDANDSYCFPGLGIHDELHELVKAGLSPMEALETATVNPASYFGLLADYGSIETGKVADMVLLDANPVEDISNTRRINTVIFNGNVYTRDELDKLLASVEKKASSINMACKLIWQEIRD